MNRNKFKEEANSSSSSDSDDDHDEIDSAASSIQNKRSVEWCGLNTWTNSQQSNSAPNIKWPPDPSTIPTNSWRTLNKVKMGNPLYGTKMQLFSKTGYNLAVYADGAVRGTRDDNDLHTHLELISAGYPGQVRIQGILTKLYVAMDNKGRLYGEVFNLMPDVTEEGTVFIESFQGSYNNYLSRKNAHLGWYLGIKKSGRFKKGPQTTYRQKAVLFLPRRSRFE